MARCTMHALLIMLCAAFGSAAGQQQVQEDPTPVWHTRFSVGFNETTKLFRWEWKTEGKLIYDVDQQAELVQRANGKGDRYCMSIHPFTATPCTHLVVGGQRYLIFPELQECCKCCSAESGCGILDPHWLDNAEYTGQVTSQGQLANQWTIRGLQPNIYEATANEGAVPLELDQLPNDYMTFHPETFTQGPVPAAVFDLPAFPCAERCPLTSVCTIALLKGVVKNAWAAAGHSVGRAVQQQQQGSMRGVGQQQQQQQQQQGSMRGPAKAGDIR